MGGCHKPQKCSFSRNSLTLSTWLSLLKLVLPPNRVDSSSFNKEVPFENNANLTDDIFHSALELEHVRDLCVFAKNPPLFMQKSFNITCAVLDLYVVLTPPLKYFDS